MNTSFSTMRFPMLRACLALSGALALIAGAASAGELRVVSPKELAPALNALAPRIEATVGATLLVDVAPPGAFSRRLAEPFDVAIVDGPTADTLRQQGKVAPGMLACLGWTGLGIAARQGATALKIATAEEVRETLLAARSIAFTGDERTGADFRAVLWQLGIPNQVEPKLIDTGNRRPVSFVAKGGAELAIALQMEIVGASSVQVAGALPPELQHFTPFYAALSSEVNDMAAARRLTTFLTSGEGLKVLRTVGLDTSVTE